jgi:hypothetical protein
MAAAPPAIRHVLFVMCGQLLADHLSCYGHPRLDTPHIDALRLAACASLEARGRRSAANGKHARRGQSAYPCQERALEGRGGAPDLKLD